MKKKMTKKIVLLAASALLSAAFALTALAATRLSTPDDLYWSSTTKEDDDDYDEGPIAKWDEVDNATRYELSLYCEDVNGTTHTMATGVTTKNNRYNFRSKMTIEGDYYFRVRAESSKSSYSNSYWSSYSDTYYVSASAAENAANGLYDDNGVTAMVVSRDPGWIQDAAGFWYQRSDGTYPTNGWFQDPSDGRWFYFDANGYVMSGFIEDGGRIYYCDPASSPYGAMVTGTVTIDGMTYNFDASGALIF